MNKDLKRTVPEHFFRVLEDLKIEYSIRSDIRTEGYRAYKMIMTFYFILCDYQDACTIETYIGNFCSDHSITKNKYHKHLYKHFVETYPEKFI